MNIISKQPIKAKSVFVVLFIPVIIILLACLVYFGGFLMGLSIFAFGMGGLIFIAGLAFSIFLPVRIFKDLNIICEGDSKRTMNYVAAWLLGSITMEIFMLYYLYSAQKRLYGNADRYDADLITRPSTVLIWFIIGYPTLGIGWLVAWIMVIRSFNKMVYAYNQKYDFYRERKDEQISAVPAEPILAVVNCVSGVSEGKTIEFTASKNKVTIGRNPQISDFVILSNMVSQVHCDIILNDEDRTFYVVDRKSTNGMLIKGERGTIKPEVDVPVEVMEGDLLVLPDNIGLTFEIRR